MILQSLARHYDILRNAGLEIAKFGYSTEGVSFALNISADGDLLDVFPQYEQVQRGKRTIDVPRQMTLPIRMIRSGKKILANFVWDNTAYVLGLSDKDASYGRERFEAFREHNIALLSRADSDAARAVIAFLEKYNPETGQQHEPVAQYQDDLLKTTGNIVFIFRGKFAHEDHAIRQVWEDHLAGPDAVKMQCLVTGEIAPIERVHAKLKGIRGTPQRNRPLVSFNDNAYESYNRSQGQNAPVSQRAAFAYTTALNYLLSDANPNRKLYLGDATVIYWAESENRAFESTFINLLDPTYEEEDAAQQDSRTKAETELAKVADKVRRVEPVDLDALLADLGDENPRFYILGLAPNAARASIRFFITDPFETIANNIMAHYQDLSIVRESENHSSHITVWRILNETISRKSRDKEASPLLAGAVFRAILTNTPYPAVLFYALLNRIRADKDEDGAPSINYVRAATIKAYLLRKYRYQPQNPFKEILTMALNEESTNPAYLLGRLFAVLERAQQDAIPDAKATIKDRYFTSACASPASIFPILLRLSQHHISKVKGDNPGKAHFRDNQIQDILSRFDVDQNPIPARLSLDEQGVFILGYYHQRANIYTRRIEEKIEQTDNVVPEAQD